MNEAVQKSIDAIKDKDLDAIMMVGLSKDGSMVIESSVNNVALMHWMLNKSIFDINVFERNNKPEPTEEKEDA